MLDRGSILLQPPWNSTPAVEEFSHGVSFQRLTGYMRFLAKSAKNLQKNEV
jgi:hypothetical protein